MFRHVTQLALCALLFTGACSTRQQEVVEFTPEQRQRIIDASLKDNDYNKDGRLTCDDVNDRRALQFRELDKDKSGTLSAIEFDAAVFADISFQFQQFRDLDEDGDKNLSQKEFSVVPDGRFLSLDRNRDCTATEEEMIASARTQLENRLRGIKLPRGARVANRGGADGQPRPNPLESGPPERAKPEPIEDLPDEDEDGGGSKKPCVGDDCST